MKKEQEGPNGAQFNFKPKEPDEGELEMGVGDDGRLVHVKLGRPVARFAIRPGKAMAFASLLASHASRCEGE